MQQIPFVKVFRIVKDLTDIWYERLTQESQQSSKESYVIRKSVDAVLDTFSDISTYDAEQLVQQVWESTSFKILAGWNGNEMLDESFDYMPINKEERPDATLLDDTLPFA